MSVTHLSVDRSLSDLWDFSTTIDLLGYDFMQQALLAMVLLGLLGHLQQVGGGQVGALGARRGPAVGVGQLGGGGALGGVVSHPHSLAHPPASSPGVWPTLGTRNPHL